MKRTIMILTALLLSVSFLMAAGGADAGRAGATNWPTQPINMVIGFAAGGSADLNARIMAKYLSTELGVPMALTNVTAAGGTVAASQVKDARPDGYTVLVTNLGINISAAAGMVDFTFEDMAPVCIFSRASDEVVAVRGDSPWNSIEDMIADSRRNPDRFRIAANTGAPSFWVAIALRNAGAQLNVVNTGGVAERITLLLGDHLDIITAQHGLITDYLATNRFKAIATTSPERFAEMPNIRPLLESGIDCSYRFDYLYLMPKGTDPAIVARLSQAVGRVVNNNQDYAREIAEVLAQTPVWVDTPQTTQALTSELNSLMAISGLLRGN